MKTITMIVPSFNEEKNIEPFYTRVRQVFRDAPYKTELIFVDDGSSDRTYSEIARLSEREAGSSRFRIKGISFSRNFGKEAAMLAGLRSASGDYISFIDADLQQDPAYVRQMADMLEEDPETDIVACRQNERKEGKLQIFLKKNFYKVINLVSDVHFEDNVSDFRTFRKSVKEALLSMPEVNRFSKGMFAWVGFRTKYIPYEVKERANGSSHWSMGKLFRYAMDGICGYSSAPMKMLSAVGGIMIAISLVWLAAGLITAGASLMTVIPFFMILTGGILMIGLGTLGAYLSRIYAEVKGRPEYIVRRKCGSGRSSYGKIEMMQEREKYGGQAI